MPGRTKKTARKLRIIDVATKVFAQKGFNDATISEIAQGAKVSEATIYEYFSTKEGLLFDIPLDTTQRLNEYAVFHLKLIAGAANKLRAIAYIYLDLYQNNPDYAAVVLLILKPNIRFRDTEAFRLIRAGFRNTTRVIKSGIESGELRSDLEPYVIRSVIMGAIDHVTTNWLMGGRKGSLIDLVDPVISALMEGILNPAAGEGAKGARGASPRPKWSDWNGARAQKTTAE